MAENLTFKLNVEGQPQASRNVQKFSKDVGNLDKAATAAGSKFGGLAGAVGNVGTIVAAQSPQFAQFAGVIGTAGSAVGGLTSAIGGVGGLAAGGLIAALGIMVVKSLQARDATADLEKTIQSLDKAQRDMTARMGEAFPQTMDDVTRAVKRTNAELIELDKQIAKLSKPSTLELIFGNIGSERARRQREQAALRFRQQQLRQRQANQGPSVDQEIAALQAQQQSRLEREVAAGGGRRRPGGRAGGAAGGDVNQFRVQGEVRTGAAAELQALGFIGADAGSPAAPDASLFGGGGLGEGDLTALRGLDTSAVDRTEEFALLANLERAVVDKEKREQDAIRETMRVREESNAVIAAGTSLLVQGSQQAITQMILGNKEGAKAALAATGDALVGFGVESQFKAAGMLFVPGMQANAAGLSAVGLAAIAVGKGMGAQFKADAPNTGAARGVGAQPVGQQQATFIQINMNPLTGEQVVKTLRGERRRGGPSAVAF